jgi:hypothetical protein
MLSVYLKDLSCSSAIHTRKQGSLTSMISKMLPRILAKAILIIPLRLLVVVEVSNGFGVPGIKVLKRTAVRGPARCVGST